MREIKLKPGESTIISENRKGVEGIPPMKSALLKTS